MGSTGFNEQKSKWRHQCVRHFGRQKDIGKREEKGTIHTNAFDQTKAELKSSL